MTFLKTARCEGWAKIVIWCAQFGRQVLSQPIQLGLISRTARSAGRGAARADAPQARVQLRDGSHAPLLPALKEGHAVRPLRDQRLQLLLRRRLGLRLNIRGVLGVIRAVDGARRALRQASPLHQSVLLLPQPVSPGIHSVTLMDLKCQIFRQFACKLVNFASKSDAHITACAPAGVGVAAPRAGCAVCNSRDHDAPRWGGGAVSSRLTTEHVHIRTWSVCV